MSGPYEYCEDCVFWVECEVPVDSSLEGPWGECHLDPPYIVEPGVAYRKHIMTHYEDFCSRAKLRPDRFEPDW